MSGGKLTGGISANETLKGNLTFVYNKWTHVALQYNSQKKQQVLNYKFQNLFFSFIKPRIITLYCTPHPSTKLFPLVSTILKMPPLPPIIIEAPNFVDINIITICHLSYVGVDLTFSVITGVVCEW